MGAGAGSATPKDVLSIRFCSQEMGMLACLRLKAFQSVWQTQICLEENKLTGFTMYLYVRSNIDEATSWTLQLSRLICI